MKHLSLLIFLLVSLTSCLQRDQTLQDLEFGGQGIGNNNLNNGVSSVDSFEKTLYVITSDKCVGCHTAQYPQHANSDVKKAHDQLTSGGFVDLENPADSLIVSFVGLSNHNCWSGSCAADAAEIQAAIQKWADELAANNIDNTNNNTNCDEPMIMVNDPVLSFQNTLHGLVTNRCATCHSDMSPKFANSEVQVAYDVLIGAGDVIANLDNPEDSRLVKRLREDQHNCWTFDCEESAVEMENAITQWANLNADKIPNPACN